MATFYLDFEGGNDASDGTSFANRWRTITSGATAARIAPGDVIRIMGSPAPTSLGVTGAWTGSALNSTVAITSSTNTTPIVVTRASHGLSNGDTVIVSGHTTNTSANGTWEIANVTTNTFELVGSVGNGVGGASGSYRLVNNCRVMLASAVTKNIALVGNSGTKTNWTASANVTNTVINSDFKQGGECQKIAIAAGFTTGLAAYYALGAVTDFSAYKQISFWIKQTAGTIGAAGSVTISLCSDTAGATPVNTVNIPLLGALNQWSPVTVDTGAALGASIQSVAFNVVTDNAAQTFLLDNIIACKDSTAADSLSLTSLIGKNTGGVEEPWIGIQSINDTRVMLDKHVNCIPTLTTVQQGYSGTSETVTAYKRETIKTTMVASSTVVHASQESGSIGSQITFSGGWNRTDMSTQTLETWLDGQNGFGTCISGGNMSFNSFEKMSGVRYNVFYTDTYAAKNFFTNVNAGHCTSTPLVVTQGGGGAFTSCGSHHNNNHGILLTSADNWTLTDIAAHGNNAMGLVLDSRSDLVTGLNAWGNGVAGLMFGVGENCYVKNLVTQYNLSAGVSTGGSGGSNYGCGGQLAYLYNASIAESTEFRATTVATGAAYTNCRYISDKHDGVAGATLITTDGGTIQTEDTVRHTASGQAWKISVNNAIRTTDYPLDFQIAKIACAASALVTVKAWMRRTNTGLTHRLVCKGGQIGGVAADVTSSMTAAADTWEELTITFTPNEAGVVCITTESYGGTTYSGYVDDLTITQA